MTSRDTQRCCEAVRSVILATAWLLVLLHICQWSWAECNSDTSILSIFPSVTLQYCDKMAKQGCPIDHHTGFLGEKYELLMGTASTKACTHWPQNVYNFQLTTRQIYRQLHKKHSAQLNMQICRKWANKPNICQRYETMHQRQLSLLPCVGRWNECWPSGWVIIINGVWRWV